MVGKKKEAERGLDKLQKEVHLLTEKVK